MISKPAESNPQGNYGSPRLTFQMMECGQLDLRQLIEEAIICVGKTKAGKTTFSFYATHQPLVGEVMENTKITVYRPSGILDRNADAKIGERETQSETQIPNIFDYNKHGINSKLLDFPGYEDTYGVYRVISNRFFHHLMFLKVKKAKFVIVVQESKILNDGKELLKTIQEFLKGFKDIQTDKKLLMQILQATSLLITKVPGQRNVDSIMATIKNIKNDVPMSQVCKQLLNAVLVGKKDKKPRVYTFQKAEPQEPCNTNNKILKEIYQNSEFWEHPEVNNEISMKNITEYIKFEAEANVQTSRKLKEQLKQFSAYYQKIKGSFKEIRTIINNIYETDTKAADPHQKAKDCLLKLIKQTKQQRQRQAESAALYKKYTKKRSEYIKQLFSQEVMPYIKEVQSLSLDLKKQMFLHQILVYIEKFEVAEATKTNDEKNSYEYLLQKTRSLKRIFDILVLYAETFLISEQLKKEEVLEYFYNKFITIQNINYIYKLLQRVQRDKNTTDDPLWQGVNNIFKQHHISLNNSIFKSGDLQQALNRETIIKAIFDKNVNLRCEGEEVPAVLKFLDGTFASLQALWLFKKREFTKMKMVKNPQNRADFDLAERNFKEIDGLIGVFYQKTAGLRSIIYQKQSRLHSPNFKVLRDMENFRLKLLSYIRDEEHNARIDEVLQSQHNKILFYEAECFEKDEDLLGLALKIYKEMNNPKKIFELLTKIQERNEGPDNENDMNDMDKVLSDYIEQALRYHRWELAMSKIQELQHIGVLTCNKVMINKAKDFKVRIIEPSFEAKYTDPYLKVIKNSRCLVSVSKELTDEIDRQISTRQDESK